MIKYSAKYRLFKTNSGHIFIKMQLRPHTDVGRKVDRATGSFSGGVNVTSVEAKRSA